eukprot:3553813-Pleurochrysis_carterae.AAC.1
MRLSVRQRGTRRKVHRSIYSQLWDAWPAATSKKASVYHVKSFCMQKHRKSVSDRTWLRSSDFQLSQVRLSCKHELRLVITCNQRLVLTHFAPGRVPNIIDKSAGACFVL